MQKYQINVIPWGMPAAQKDWAGPADAWLFWDAKLGEPPSGKLQELLDQPVDVWHAGLKLGMNGLPGIIDFVQPAWMLNRDPDPAIEATSWRVSLRACLIRAEVLQKMGGVRPEFQTLEAAGLEMGHRFISGGVLMRHVPDLVPKSFPHILGGNPQLPFEDELRFVYYRFGKKWAIWALIRAVLSGYVSPGKAFAAWRVILRAKPEESIKKIFRRSPAEILRYGLPAGRQAQDDKKVSVLIPTLNRYSYLSVLLDQFRKQTVKPLEIILVDQTPLPQRELNFAGAFSDLPLKIIYRDQPGQCSSRNAGLQAAKGEYILFLDDDDEIQPDLIEKHLKHLNDYQNEVSSGVAEEDGAGPLPKNFTYLRSSDVFPTNNTMIRRDVLLRSGLFDLAYDRKQRADADLGMRIYLSGVQMILNPEIAVLHHHAPQGGLRTHKARVITYAGSRKSLFQRHLPSDSEIYLGMRYFTSRQVREAIWLRVLGTFSARGTKGTRILKAMISLILLPQTLWQICSARESAKVMLQKFNGMPGL